MGSRLDRLAGAGAIQWEPSWGTYAGRIEILVHHQLVRAGRGDRRVGYIQIMPAPIAAAVARHRLSATAQAMLRRLLVEVDHRSRTVRGSVRQLTAHFGLGRPRFTAAVNELVVAGVVRRSGDAIHVCAYDQFVRAAPPQEAMRPRPDRASAAAESRGHRVQNARPSLLLEVKDEDPEPEHTVNPQAPLLSSVQVQVGSSAITPGGAALAALALALPVDTHHELLVDPGQLSGRQALRRRLAALAAQLGQADAVAGLAWDWPEGVASAMALANYRADRRLAELGTSAATAASVAELAAQAAARRRRDALAGARNLGRAWGSSGGTAEEVAAEFAGDEEALNAAMGAFRAAVGVAGVG
jgi:hypothetical protein